MMKRGVIINTMTALPSDTLLVHCENVHEQQMNQQNDIVNTSTNCSVNSFQIKLHMLP